MQIKLILSNSVGHIDHKYLTVTPDLGGYAAGLAVPADWCLDHGDTIKVVFLDRLEDDERTAEDDRVILANKDGVLRGASERGRKAKAAAR